MWSWEILKGSLRRYLRHEVPALRMLDVKQVIFLLNLWCSLMLGGSQWERWASLRGLRSIYGASQRAYWFS